MLLADAEGVGEADEALLVEDAIDTVLDEDGRGDELETWLELLLADAEGVGEADDALLVEEAMDTVLLDDGITELEDTWQLDARNLLRKVPSRIAFIQ